MIILNAPKSELAENEDGTFEKEVIRYGEYVDKYDTTQKMVLDEKIADSIIKNSTKFGKIPIPRSHWDDDATRNTGYVAKFVKTATGLSARMKILAADAVDAIKEGRVWDVSVGLFHDYLDSRKNKRVGARVHHVALTNEPYLKGMDGFKFDENSDTRLYEFVENGKSGLTSKNENDKSVTNMSKNSNLDADKVDDKVDETQEEETQEEEESTDSDDEQDDSNDEETDASELSQMKTEMAELRERADKAEEKTFNTEQHAAYNVLLHEGRIVPADEGFFKSITKDQESLDSAVKHYKSQPVRLVLGALTTASKPIESKEEAEIKILAELKGMKVEHIKDLTEADRLNPGRIQDSQNNKENK